MISGAHTVFYNISTSNTILILQAGAHQFAASGALWLGGEPIPK